MIGRMARLILPILALGLAAPAAAQRPILPDFHADPSAHEWDGRYWIYPSHDLPGSKDWDMVDWHAFSSTDLVHWTDHGVIFSLKDIPWAKKWAWAPDAMKRNGKYYLYVTADDQIGVGVADKPYGPFADALGKHVQGPSWFERRVTAEYLGYEPDGSIRVVRMTKEGVRARRPPAR
jgi:beta-xylosidase